jgi:4-amino-4-deoxy-L-arabinose transferase-like glycosyltransferase
MTRPQLRSVADFASSAFPWLAAALGALLLLTRLADHYLWQDEAQTALIARTVVERGLPYGTDGRNFFSQEGGAEYGPGYLWKWHTWLSFYTTAASFLLLGPTTFAARLPAALFGLATILLIFECGRRLLSRSAGIVACSLLLTCVPFLLLCRQARYYSAAAFFALLSLTCWREARGGRRPAAVVLVLSSIALFHAHYLYFFTLAAAFLVESAVCARSELRRALLLVAIPSLANLPWMIWLGTSYPEAYAGAFSGARIAERLLGFSSQIRWILPPAALAGTVLLLGAGALLRRVGGEARAGGMPSHRSPAILLSAFVVVTVATLALSAPGSFFRYLAPVIAPIHLLVAATLDRLAAPARRLTFVIPILAAASQPLSDFLYELRNDYRGPIGAIVQFLEVNSEPGDVVAITYGDLPLKFYLDLRVVGGLTGEDLGPALEARWVILRRNTITDADRRVREYLETHLPLDTYRRHWLPTPDLKFENRESPDEHRYRSARGRYGLTILERPDTVP